MKNIRHINRDEKDPNTLNGRSMVLPIAFCLVCGVLLILFGNITLRITAYVLSGVMVICGGWYIITYIRSEPILRITGAKLAIGLVLLMAGILLAFNPDYLKDLIPFVWGLALLFGGFLKTQYAFDEKSVQVNRWWIMLIFAAFSVIIGILSLLNPAFLGDSRNLVIGILLVVEAVLDITVFFLLRHALKKLLSDPVYVSVPISTEAASSQAESETPPKAGEQDMPATQVVPDAPAAPEQAVSQAIQQNVPVQAVPEQAVPQTVPEKPAPEQTVSETES